MRPGRPEDLRQVAELWQHEVEIGRQDAAPSEDRSRLRLARFNWDAGSRVLERDGRLEGAVIVIARPSPDGVLADIYAAGRGGAYSEMAGWGVNFARALGASIIHTMAAKDRGQELTKLGLRPVRPWWRMDRALMGDAPPVEPIAGYDLIDASEARPGSWADVFNRAFADHWRFVPRSEAEIIAGKPAELCLMAVSSLDGAPAAISLGELEEFAGDARSQPVGLVSSVGTAPEHRRRGLAGWLVAETLRRLGGAGARHASLYVDGLNPTRAYDVYRKLGFEVAHEAQVWEATVP